MSTIQGDRAYGVLPGFWFGAGPHTPAQRVWLTRSCGWRSTVTCRCEGGTHVARWVGERRGSPGERAEPPVSLPAARQGEGKAWCTAPTWKHKGSGLSHGEACRKHRRQT
jgi:hypothetical protein